MRDHLLGRPTEQRKIVFSRSFFLVFVYHWALTVLAVPVFAIINHKAAFGIYWIAAFLFFFVLSLTTPSRYLISSRGRTICPKLERFARILRIALIPLTLLSFGGFGLFLFLKGLPEMKDGLFYVMNHGKIILEITQEEYILLSRIERVMFCSGLAWISSGSLLIKCYADDVRN